VTLQVAGIQSNEPNLFEGSFVQNPSNSSTSFTQYLEEETKQLSLMFSPINQFNFSAWFDYPGASNNALTPKRVSLFSDVETNPEHSIVLSSQDANTNSTNQTSAVQALEGLLQNYSTKPSQTILQDLLMQSGWLTPNLSASSLFFQSQLDGTFLSNFDLQFLVDQIVSQMEVVSQKGSAQLSLGLRPGNLGEILLTLTSQSGMVSIQIQVPEELRKLIESSLLELELALKRANINVSEIKVLATKEAS